VLIRDALLAYAHFALILLLAGLLLAEVALYRRTMQRAILQTLQRIDLTYGIVAGLVIVSGISRILWGLKGAGFYLHNPIFWAKMATFAVVAPLSLPPTFHYLRLGKQAGSAISVNDSAFRTVRRLLVAGDRAALPHPPLRCVRGPRHQLDSPSRQLREVRIGTRFGDDVTEQRNRSRPGQEPSIRIRSSRPRFRARSSSSRT
jgi:putative membrane protein